MYYTPQAIIDQITNRIFEPAAGTGALLAAATKSPQDPILANPPYAAPDKAPTDRLPKGGPLPAV